MDAKIIKLLDKINYDKDNYDYFSYSKLDKIIVSKNKNSWDIYLHNPTNFLPDVVFSLYDCLKIYLKEFSFRLNIVVDEINYELINDYYFIILKEFNHNNLYFNIFSDRLVRTTDKYQIEVYNSQEYNLINKFIDNLNKKFKSFGFDINIEIFVNKEMGEQVKQEIENVLIDTPVAENKPVKLKEKAKDDKKVWVRPKAKGEKMAINNISTEMNNISVEANVFGIDYFEPAGSNLKIITLKITDFTDSMFAKVKMYTDDIKEYEEKKELLKVGKSYLLTGYVKNDIYAKDLVLYVNKIEEIEPLQKIVEDLSEVKRVELHTHTKMSQMDGVVSAEDLISRAKAYGHKAIAVTDHNSLQAFPVFAKAKDIKVIYGVELNLINDAIDIVSNSRDFDLKNTTYVIFDFETTGFNAGGEDSIIEVGAVKLQDGKVIDRFSKLIDPGKHLHKKITEITGITDAMLKNCDSEENVIKEFIEWFKDLPMVAHNAKFDVSFLESAYNKYNLGKFDNTVIDTLELSRSLDPSLSRHSLSVLVKKYEVPFDEESHHRGDYDAEATGYIFSKMIDRILNFNIDNVKDLNSLISKDVLKNSRPFHINFLVKNQTGLKNLFKMVSVASTDNLTKTARIFKSEISKYKEGLLIGSSCYNGEIFESARSKSEEELKKIMLFYDYIEIQPLENYLHLVDTGEFGSKGELINHLNKIINVAKDGNKLIVATGDVHHLDREDKIYREVIINQKVPGGGFHPLNKKEIKTIPSQHFRTTDEMLKSYDYIESSEDIYNYVIVNTNKIADMIEDVTVLRDGLSTPVMENSKEQVRDITYTKAKEIYGDPLPEIIETRLEQELSGIINGGYDVIYLIAQRLVKDSNDHGYLVGSRGSVGSSLVATFMNITEVNPLPPHYVCPNCKKSIFEIDGKVLAHQYSSGYDLPDMICECGTKMKKNGQNIPFATFLGFKAEKVPDIDLNFSGDYQANAHNYTKVLFGADKVYRAGTISTVAEKTAYGFVKGFIEDKGIYMRPAEIERIAIGVQGTKRTTGQHPGGIIVIPNYMDVFDFTPYQFPADDKNATWYTTHFDFHTIHDNVLKLDILGHDDPTVIKILQDLTGIDIKDVPLDDKDVLSLFTSPKALGTTKDKILFETGSQGLPEFGTKNTNKMLVEIKPKTFADLIKISGLSHGEGIWYGNEQELVANKVVEFKDTIGCRDDIMTYLIDSGLESSQAFKTAEFVRKGKPTSDPKGWIPFKEHLEEMKIPDWYIESCSKIKYMFPKAHATAYVTTCLRIAWFKINYPLEYYCSYFSVRTNDFDIDTMINGYDTIKDRVIELNNKGYDITNKESNILSGLEIALEMTARGYGFGEIDLYKSDSKMFVIDKENKILIPPFRALEGLGDTVAKAIVAEREKRDFISIEDLQKRAKVSSPLIDKMRLMGILKDLPESSQLTLF